MFVRFIIAFFTFPVIFLIFNSLVTRAQSVRINEVQSSNVSTIAEWDGKFYDWIEIYNYGFVSVNLQGWGLTDNPDNPFKWVFPAIQLLPREYLVVFASGNSAGEWPAHWETVIKPGDSWRYFVGIQEPPSEWRDPAFNHNTWEIGPGGFGYGDGDDATEIPRTISVYIRKRFEIKDLDQVASAILHVDYDDGFVAYMNGHEIARANLGDPGTFVPYNRQTDTWREAKMNQGGVPDTFPIQEIKSLLRKDGGPNILALQAHNVSLESSDLSLIPFYSLGLKGEPANPEGIDPVLNGLFPGIHTNFRISSKGETIVLSSPEGKEIDRIATGRIPADSSLGRDPYNSSAWLFYNEPTPGGMNGPGGVAGILSVPKFSHPPGIYPDEIELTLTTESQGCQIRFTSDGSEPGESSALYAGSIRISEPTVVRARCFRSGYLPSQTVTGTYLIGLTTTLPVVSLASDPENFFDPQTGIYVDENAEKDWERPLHVEFFEPDGTLGFSIDAGVAIYGGWTQQLPQKSLAIYARSKYGDKEIRYRIFPDKPIEAFEAIVLRNSGNDWYTSGSPDDYWPLWKPVMFRDGLMTSLAKGLEVDTQAYRPAIVFLNGRYWGIHNIREKINEHFIAANNRVDPDDLDLLEQWGYAIHGSGSEYLSLIEFADSHYLSENQNYEYVTSRIDIDSFIDYYLSQIYFANTDWPGNNIKFWRPQSNEGKWRWILYDTDFGLGLAENVNHNTLAFALEDNGPDWPNPPWSTLLFRRLMENESFQRRFLNRFCVLAGTNFETGRVLSELNRVADGIRDEMPRHIARWGGNLPHWEWSVSLIRSFLANRLPIMKNQIASRFGFKGMSDLSIEVSPVGGGLVQVDGRELTDLPWTGEFFDGITVSLHPVAAPGFIFSHWKERTDKEEDISIIVDGDVLLTAVFESRPLIAAVVVNEINYSSDPSSDSGDWIELFNPGDSAVDLDGWKIQDSSASHVKILPNYILEPGDYLVICEDESKFKPVFPGLKNLLGDLGFGLSRRGDTILVYDPYGNLADSISYSDQHPWPQEGDVRGGTLELVNPALDNSLAVHWNVSDANGTPGRQNSGFKKRCSLDGDLDEDGLVTVMDVVLMIHSVVDGKFQMRETTACISDLDRDGKLGVTDLNLSLKQFQ